MAQHNDLGKEGESRAKSYLQSKGYTILHTNWRYKHKEIDLIAKKDGWLIFVEVKTRTQGGMQTAEQSITTSKMRYLVEAADAYITENERKEEAQFDLIAINVNQGSWEMLHIKEAFNPMDI